MKAYFSAALCVGLGASLGACKVYDQALASATATRATTDAGSGQNARADGFSTVDAGKAQARAAVQPTAAGSGSRPTRELPIARTSGAESIASADDAGVGDEATASVSTADAATGPAADGGEVDVDRVCAAETDGRCGHGWLRRITLDGSQVSAPLTDFPVLVRLDDPHLLEHAAVGGDDLYFTADDGLTVLDFEIESYSASGELVAWVRLPSLEAEVDSTLFLGYGDGESGRAKPTAVWSDFHNVWHLAQDPSAGDSAIRDSTERAHGSAQGSMTANASISGVAGPGLTFDGVDDEILFFNDLWGSGPSTFSGWVKQRGNLGQYGTSMISLGDGNNNGSARFMLSHADAGKVKCGFFGDDDLTTAILPLNEWKYLAWTWDGSASAVYIDAVRVLGPVSHSQVNTAGRLGKIGNTTFRFAYFMYGQLDELHIATTARSSAWIATEYANQRPASSFIKAIGQPEPAAEH